MGFNYGIAKKRFDEEWRKLRKEYEEAGMSEKDIQEIYEFDMNAFRKNRTECMHTQPISDSNFCDGNDQGETMSVLLQKFRSELSVNDTHNFQTNPRFSWIDEIENYALYLKVIALPEKDIELLTMIAFEGFSQKEVTEIRDVAPSAICKKNEEIKKNLVWGLIIDRYHCLPSEEIYLYSKETDIMKSKCQKHTALDDELCMCLCSACLSQFNSTNSYEIKRISHRQAKEKCDYCNHRFGYDYILQPIGRVRNRCGRERKSSYEKIRAKRIVSDDVS